MKYPTKNGKYSTLFHSHSKPCAFLSYGQRMTDKEKTFWSYTTTRITVYLARNVVQGRESDFFNLLYSSTQCYFLLQTSNESQKAFHALNYEVNAHMRYKANKQIQQWAHRYREIKPSELSMLRGEFLDHRATVNKEEIGKGSLYARQEEIMAKERWT